MKITLINFIATVAFVPIMGLANTSTLGLANQSPSEILKTQTMYITPSGSALIIQVPATTQGGSTNAQTEDSTSRVIIGKVPLQIGSSVTINNKNYAVKSIARTSAGEKIVILDLKK